MNLQKFNSELRNLLESLVSDGFLQKDITAVTFGMNRQDQLRAFLGGRDISGKPLQRILDGLGFELHLVPVSKKDPEDFEMAETVAADSFAAMRLILVNYLEGVNQKRRQRSPMIEFVDSIVQKINLEG